MKPGVRAILEFELEYLQKRLPEIEQEFKNDEEKIGWVAHASESGKYLGLLLGVVEKLEKALELEKELSK